MGTQPQLQKLGLVSITSSISCTPNVLLSIGMSEKVWKKESSLKLVKIWLLWRRITKKLVWTLWKARVKKEKNTKEIFNHNNLTRKKDQKSFIMTFIYLFLVTLKIIPVHFQCLSVLMLPECTALP